MSEFLEIVVWVLSYAPLKSNAKTRVCRMRVSGSCRTAVVLIFVAITFVDLIIRNGREFRKMLQEFQLLLNKSTGRHYSHSF